MFLNYHRQQVQQKGPFLYTIGLACAGARVGASPRAGTSSRAATGRARARLRARGWG